MPSKDQELADLRAQTALLKAQLEVQTMVSIRVATNPYTDPKTGEVKEKAGRVELDFGAGSKKVHLKPEDALNENVCAPQMIARITEVVRENADFLNRRAEEQGRSWRFIK